MKIYIRVRTFKEWDALVAVLPFYYLFPSFRKHFGMLSAANGILLYETKTKKFDLASLIINPKDKFIVDASYVIERGFDSVLFDAML